MIAANPIVARADAVVVARSYALGIALAEKAQGTVTGAQVVAFDRWLRKHPPATVRVLCSGSKVWRVTWKQVDPIFVGRTGIRHGC